MAVRPDVTFDYGVSPRSVLVDSPSAVITIQDLHDTARVSEALLDNMVEKSIIFSEGKAFIDTGEFVGVTATLKDTTLGFAARPGPSFVQVKVTGGNLVSVDGAGVPVDPFKTTAFTQVVYRGSTSPTLLNNTAALADKVWQKLLSDVVADNTYGRRLQQLLRLADFLVLKE